METNQQIKKIKKDGNDFTIEVLDNVLSISLTFENSESYKGNYKKDLLIEKSKFFTYCSLLSIKDVIFSSIEKSKYKICKESITVRLSILLKETNSELDLIIPLKESIDLNQDLILAMKSEIINMKDEL